MLSAAAVLAAPPPSVVKRGLATNPRSAANSRPLATLFRCSAAPADGRSTQQQQRQQGRAPPARGRRQRRAGGDAPELDKALRGLSVDQLLDLLGDSELTAQRAAGLLSAIDAAERETGSGRSALQAHGDLPRLFAALQRGCGELTLSSLVVLLRQCARLGLRLPPPLLEAITKQVCHRLPAAAPSEAASAAWDLTRLGHRGVSTLLAAIDTQVQQQQQQAGQERGAQPGWQQQLQQQQAGETEQAGKQATGQAGVSRPGGQAQAQLQAPVRRRGRLATADGTLSPWLAQVPPYLLIHLLWACGKAGFQSQPLLHGITRALLASPPATLVLSAPGSSGSGANGSSNGRVSRGGGTREVVPLGRLDVQQVMVLFYSLGLLQWAPDREFLRHACREAHRHLPAFTSQGLGNTAWALSRLGSQPALVDLAQALAAEAAPRLAEFSNQELGMLLMAASAPQARSAWRAGAAGGLLQAAGAELARRAPGMNERDLYSTLSALATAGSRPPDAALGAAARRAEQLLPGGLSPSSAAWILWSFAHFRYSPPRSLLRKAEAALRGPQLVSLYELEPASLARLCWALAELKYYSGGLLSDLATVLRTCWERLPPQSMAMVLHSYAQQHFTPHELLDAAAEHLAANLPSYSPQAVAMTMWSFGRLGVHPGRGLPAGGLCTPEGAPLMSAVAEYGMHHARLPPQQQQAGQQGSKRSQQQAGKQQGQQAGQEFTLQGLAMLLWSFATLEHHPGTPLLHAACTRVVGELQQWQQQVVATSLPGAGAAEAGRAAAAAAAAGGRQGGAPAPPACLRSVSQVAWSLAKFGHQDEELFFVLAAGPLPPASEAEDVAQSLTLLAYSAAKLRAAAAPAVLQRIVPLAERHLASFTSEELCQLLWALSSPSGGQQGRVPLRLLDAAAERLAADLRVDGGGGSSKSASSSSSGNTGRPAAAARPPDARLLCMAVHALGELQYRCSTALLDACLRRVEAASAEVSVSLLAKLLWGCAHVGHAPEERPLDALLGDLYHRLSHRRGNRTVLNVPDLVLLLWALAVLQQYHTPLYRNLAFRVTRLPDGVPQQPRLRRLLREATVLHSCEHRLDPVAAEAAGAILPAWLASKQAQHEQQQAAQEAADQQGEGEEGSGSEDEAGLLPQPDRQASLAPNSAASAASGTGQPPLERLAEAEAICSALRSAGLPAGVKQLAFGDHIVVVEGRVGTDGVGRGRSSRWQRGGQPAAVVVPASPGTGRAAVNDCHILVGSALMAHRVVQARGLLAVPGTGSGEEVVERCLAALRGEQEGEA